MAAKAQQEPQEPWLFTPVTAPLERDIQAVLSLVQSSYITALSLVESFIVIKYLHSDATPALLHRKEAFRWFFMA